MLLEPLRLPVQFREFESGVRVLQLRSHSDKEFLSRIEKAVSEKGSVTVVSLSNEFNISIILAKEQLLV